MSKPTVTAKSPEKPWTHIVRDRGDDIVQQRIDCDRETTITGRMHLHQIDTIRLQGETAIFWSKHGRKASMLVKNAAMDPVTYAICCLNQDIMQILYTSWVTNDGSERGNTIELGQMRKWNKQVLHHRHGRYHLSGVFGNTEFAENRIVLEGVLPITVMEERKYKKLKEVLGNDELPEEAVVTNIYEKDGKTVIAYDAADIELSDIFGCQMKHAFLPAGTETRIL